MSASSERERILALRGYGILDSENEPAFDAIVRETAQALGVPIALISLIDEDRQWFKARFGLEPSETPRSISFCTHAIRGRGIMVVPDATRDTRFADNPLVTGAPSIRFYAGAPLATAEGKRIGTLCAIALEPRDGLDPVQRDRLTRLAEQTMRCFEERRIARRVA